MSKAISRSLAAPHSPHTARRNHYQLSAIVLTLLIGCATRWQSNDDRSRSNSGSSAGTTAPWTVMIYAGVDSSAEPYIMPHLKMVRDSAKSGVFGNVVMLIDRVNGASNNRSILGANFDDTRLFELTANGWRRVPGSPEFPEITESSTHEANTGDPRTLQKFIRFARRACPAENFALVLFGHGECRSVCPDISSECADSGETEDPLFPAEISESLTATDSVDVLWVDVCSFGAIENAYQFRSRPDRFHARVMLATPPLSSPAPLSRVLEKTGLIGRATDRGPIPRDAREFGISAIAAIEQRIRERGSLGQPIHFECWGCYDLTRADAVKSAVDQMAIALNATDGRYVAEEVRRTLSAPSTMHYAYIGHPRQWIVSPYFDLFDLARRLSNDERLSPPVRLAAREVMTTVDELVIASTGMERYRDFTPGTNGIFIVFPGVVDFDGDKPAWSAFTWYHPFDRRKHRNEFGQYDWCRDGATPNNGRVENWFELLDTWFDDDTPTGGWNEYRP